MLTATSSGHAGKHPSYWKTFSNTAKRSRVAPVLLLSRARSSGESVQCWVSSSGYHSGCMKRWQVWEACGTVVPHRVEGMGRALVTLTVAPQDTIQEHIQNCAEWRYCAVILRRRGQYGYSETRATG